MPRVSEADKSDLTVILLTTKWTNLCCKTPYASRVAWDTGEKKSKQQLQTCNFLEGNGWGAKTGPVMAVLYSARSSELSQFIGKQVVTKD